VIDSDRPRFEKLRARGAPVLYGDARQSELLVEAGIHGARVLLVATAEPFQSRRVVEVARALNPQLSIIARAHSDAEQAALSAAGADHAFTGEHELAQAMLRKTLHETT
jgi:CPA2 family monovalent cation:H+ antiporter-2